MIARVHLVRQPDGTVAIEVYDEDASGELVRREPGDVRDPLADRYDNFREAGNIAGSLPDTTKETPCRR